MYCDDPYELCCRYHGKVVRIYDKSGEEHVGRITRVTKERVWLDSPYDRGHAGYYGGGYYGGGWGFSIAIGFIAGIALAGLFFI